MLTPPHWEPGSPPMAAAPWLARVAAGPSLLMLDYDGTLAPFHDDRMQALPSPGIVERLEELIRLPSVHLVLVTGRSARELASLVPIAQPIEIWGSHGREHIAATGAYSAAELSPPQQTALDQFEAALHQAGFSSSVERKPASLAAHWRTLDNVAAAEVEQIARRVYREQGQSAGLQLLVFDGGIEMRSEAIHKGHAVLHMLKQFPNAAAAYLGDDLTDEDAFLALRGHGLTILVRDQPRPSHAEFWLRPPDELIAFLDAWITAAKAAAVKIAAGSQNDQQATPEVAG
jgi:trehalose-phosphatase